MLNEDTQLVMRAIGVSHTACKDEFRRNRLEIFHLTAGVYFVIKEETRNGARWLRACMSSRSSGREVRGVGVPFRRSVYRIDNAHDNTQQRISGCFSVL